MVIGHTGAFDFWKKIAFFLVRVRYKSSLVFRISLVCRKFTFSAGLQVFGLKTTSHGKPDLKNIIAEVGFEVRPHSG